ncbi:MAG: NADH-quinone oxidoreductase subunit H [Myxococcota bacterium]|nr:NADH-quinone oxidoreductase subunit H [Myxococcota bacterium]
MVEIVTHLALLLLFPPLLLGIIVKTKALFAGRVGAPLLQPYSDLWKLLKKGAVYSRTTTWIFRAGPIIALASVLTAGVVLPLASTSSPFGFAGDVILFAYLLALGRFVTMAAALDTGSPFEGMGASREAAFSALVEPALFLVLGIICLPAASVSFSNAWAALPWQHWGVAHPCLLAASAALFIVLLTENSRIPVDDPNTHLELTMIHEVMVLDHSGPDFAFILYGASIKLFLFGSLLIHLLLPISAGISWQNAALFLGGQVGMAILVGIVESRRTMNLYSDFLLLFVVMLNLYIVSANRLTACVKASALQGAALALLPIIMWWNGSPTPLVHVILMAVGTLAFKAIVIPIMLARAIRNVDARREVEPFVSLHLSLLLAALLVGVSFWLAGALELSAGAPSRLLVPASFSTLLIGFLVLVSRKKAITQVIGYLMIENGVFVFSQSVAAKLPFVVELGVLLDLLVAIFVMNIVIHQINREFDHINVDKLDLLKG